MPGPLTNPRRRRRDNDDGTDGISAPSSPGSNGSKRPRYESDAFSRESEEPVLPESYRSQARRLADTAESEDDEGDGEYTPDTYQPGSIVRVKLTNFVTYTSAEFDLGPSLNMIIGPNGTGKSTLVCAICLGLGWGPQHLGRAKELGEFVKHGSREAEIEIELAAGPAQKGVNPVIRRSIKREGNKSHFFLNGRQVPQKEVIKLAREFSIQIDNLCQFLPQDRVVEFAGLSPVDLLTETQRAAAPAEMQEWHEELKTYRQKEKTLQSSRAHDREHMAQLRARQNLQKADVDRMKEREALQKKVEALEMYKPSVAYKEATIQHNEVRRRRDEAVKELGELEKEMEPLLRAVNTKAAYLEQISNVFNQRKGIVANFEEEADSLLKSLETIQGEVEDCERQKEAEKARDRGRKLEKTKIEQAIQNLKRKMEHAPGEFDPAEFNEKIRDASRRLHELEAQAQDVRTIMKEVHEEATAKNGRRNELIREKENRKTQAGQRNANLRNVSADSATAWEWIQNNRNLFEGRVYGPPMVECDVKDPRYADAVEMLFQRTDFLAFTCTSLQDFKLLQERLHSRAGLGLSDISVRVTNCGLEHWKPPVSQEVLQGCGLDGWIVDYLEGPEPVLSMLCDSVRLHSTGVTLRNLDDRQYERLRESNISAWVTGKQFYRVTRRREYGPSAVSTRVQDKRPAKVWTEQAVDMGEEADLQRQIDELKDAEVQLRAAFEAHKEKLSDLKKQAQMVVEEKTSLGNEKARKQKEKGEFDALPTKLTGLEEKLEALKEAGAQSKGRLDDITSRQDDLALKKGQVALQYATKLEGLRKAHRDLLKVEIWQIEAQSELEVLKRENNEVTCELEQRRKEVQHLVEAFRKVREEAKSLGDAARRATARLTEQQQDIQRQLKADLTMEELEAEITSVHTRLELLHGGNPHAIREFENREKEIEKLNQKLEEHERNLAQIHEDIGRVRQQWEPRLDELVRQISDAFSYNFEKIGCAGQVDIHKDDDFDQWAIQIYVRFRENEQLSLLNSHRQSGGERAVSTIFYLMALQSLARSPFRVVDEINQGMDPRNERMVHERMVDIACKEHTSQYFLITPKLLHGLKFHRRMKVHCIASGEYMPTNYLDLDFSRLANVALRVKGIA